MPSIPVYIEATPKRAFAGGIDWPGWARSGRTEADALAALAAFRERYSRAVGARIPEADLEVVERLPGSASTEFGAPGAIPGADRRPLEGAEADRWIGYLQGAWAALDEAARNAEGRELRKGPRGGGRELAKILDHVLGAETSYLASLGTRYRGTDAAELREAVINALRARTEGRWPARYFIRRAAWHVLDHAWEIEDRARGGP